MYFICLSLRKYLRELRHLLWWILHGKCQSQPVSYFLYLDWFWNVINCTYTNSLATEIHHGLTNSAEVSVILSFGHVPQCIIEQRKHGQKAFVSNNYNVIFDRWITYGQRNLVKLHSLKHSLFSHTFLLEAFLC